MKRLAAKRTAAKKAVAERAALAEKAAITEAAGTASVTDPVTSSEARPSHALKARPKPPSGHGVKTANEEADQ
jgi:hypothetical protein